MSEGFDAFRYLNWREAVFAWRGQDRERSLRWLSEKTGVSLGHLSEILSPTGPQRPPPPDLVRLLLTLIEGPRDEREYLAALVEADVERGRVAEARDAVAADEHRERQAVAQARADLLRVLHAARERDPPGARLLGRWLAVILYEARACGVGPGGLASLAERLRPEVSPRELEEAVELLERSDLLALGGEGAGIHWYSAEDDAEERRRTLRAAHLAGLAHFAAGLDPTLIPRNLRRYKLEIQAMPASLLPDVERRMDELIAWIHQESARRGPSDSVYVFGFQAVPALVPPEAD